MMGWESDSPLERDSAGEVIGVSSSSSSILILFLVVEGGGGGARPFVYKPKSSVSPVPSFDLLAIGREGGAGMTRGGSTSNSSERGKLGREDVGGAGGREVSSRVLHLSL